jgi:DNA-binding SARP family transcriptional activator
MLARMWLGVLGATVVRASTDDAGPVTTLKAAKHRALLAALAVQPGRAVPADVLVEALWGADAPPSAQATLHTYLSVVRRTLEPDLAARTPSQYLVSSDLGYELRLPDGGLDAAEFARTVSDVHAALGPLASATAPHTDDPVTASRALARLERALALWRGEPYADVVGADLVAAERARLEELRILALEDRATLLIASGAPGSAASELEALTARHPLRERPWTLLAVAQARTGRQADALATIERLRQTLDDQLGIEPSPAVRQLQTAILRQEPEVSTRDETGRRAPVEPGKEAGPLPVELMPIDPMPIDLSVPEWPLVGRELQLDQLRKLLAAADGGTPGFAALVGEPGAGKSRLATELCLIARDVGATILVGRCSQDEDAPPLWPWTTALGPSVATDLPVSPAADGDHDAARFQVADAIRRALQSLASERTVVMVLEDLHWADPSSLRVLRHLCTHLESGRLLVVCTWRRGADEGPLNEAAEALARRHASRLDITGLSETDAHEVLRSVAGDAIDAPVAAAAHGRTEGNPFFLIEYARLARDEHRDLADVLDGLPRTVSDVVRRRIHQLPQTSADVLTAGAVIGREFDLGLLGQELAVGETILLDLLEPALAVDLVQDLGADRFRFGHALVRDTAYAELTPSRRERMHASLADLIAATPRPERRAPEIARHWAAAGDRHARKAWHAAAFAARSAMAAHAAEEATAHYLSALDLLGGDPDATPRDRWDLLVGYADACRWSTRLVEMNDALDEAVGLADALGEPELVVGAASVAAEGSVWPIRSYGFVNEEVVGAMRRALAQVPTEDSEVRCRLLMLLAGELFYGRRPAEIDALVEESIAMARRLGDRRLLLSVLLYGFSSTWRRGTIVARRSMATEAVSLAQDQGDIRSELLARFLLASVRIGLGELDGVAAEVASIQRQAGELRLYFLEMATITQTQSWAAMRGDEAAIVAGETRLHELEPLISLSQKTDALRGAILVPQIWGREISDAESFNEYIENASVPIAPGLTVLLLRKGMTEFAEQVWAEHDYEMGDDDWFSELHWSFGAEIAVELGDPDLGADLYQRLIRLRGQCVISGTGPAHGPADVYLACAAAATGERALASEHADVAAALCEAWDVPQVAVRLGDLRERHGF